jgi:hypothetical protein
VYKSHEEGTGETALRQFENAGRTAWPALILITIGVLVGCGDDPTSSQVPDVTNTQDNFHFALKDAKSLDTTITYWWQMGGTTANVNQNSDIKGGNADVIIEDAADQQVYRTDLTEDGSFASSFGAEGGFWKIRFTLSKFSGSIDFRAQRK